MDNQVDSQLENRSLPGLPGALEGASLKEALRDSEERYRLLLEGIEDYAIFMMDSTGHVLSWNKGAQRIKGYTADQILGKSFECFFAPEVIAGGWPQEVLRRAAAGARYEEQSMRVRRDGSRFLADVTITALRDADGHLLGFSEFSHDLSDTKEQEARYRGLMEAAPDAMVVVDPQGRIVLLNLRSEKQFGYRRDELVGRQVSAIIPKGFAERLLADALRSPAAALGQEIGSGIELVGQRKNGSAFPIEIMLSPLESSQGLLVTAAIRDITARKKAEAALLMTVAELKRSNESLAQSAERAALANRELEAFSYSVSHDLRTPLRSLDGFSQVLLEDYGDKLDEEGKDSLLRIRAASQRMGMLIDDMLSLSQVTRREIVPAKVDLSEMAAAIIAELRQREPGRNVRFSYTSGMCANTDEHLIRIALTNLLANAWKFSNRKPDAQIEFGCSDRTGVPIFFVRDNGAGFDMAYAGKLFGAFQRMHSAKDFEGTGIGLATVRRVMQRLGGRVWGEAATDLGATFYFVLAPVAGAGGVP
ncbi:MAG: PAS domain S-box protein [Burkholderiaceae bacterium]